MVAVRIRMVRGLSDLRELGVQKLGIFWVFLGVNCEEEDDFVGGDLGCAKLMMEGKFKSGCAISSMVVMMWHGSWWWMGFRVWVVAALMVKGCRFFATLTMWVVAAQSDRVWT
ncbi:hypothetical protein V8G54_035699 [Vigna mungo]|uniref:Transmembrane protein n=1 Tax=Vigna mungo TaxID=3915 RepID=A0AAQ3MFX8_VIGMU